MSDIQIETGEKRPLKVSLPIVTIITIAAAVLGAGVTYGTSSARISESVKSCLSRQEAFADTQIRHAAKIGKFDTSLVRIETKLEYIQSSIDELKEIQHGSKH